MSLEGHPQRTKSLTKSAPNGTKDLITCGDDPVRERAIAGRVLTHAHKAHVPRRLGGIRGRRSRKKEQIYERDRELVPKRGERSETKGEKSRWASVCLGQRSRLFES